MPLNLDSPAVIDLLRRALAKPERSATTVDRGRYIRGDGAAMVKASIERGRRRRGR